MWTKDHSEFIFRLFFCGIFMALGSEHIFSDALIQHLMPDWVSYPHLTSVFVGIFLMIGGGLIMLGYRIKLAALLLGAFLIGVTLAVHVPALFSTPDHMPEEWSWLWVILQRSNFAKNVCLLGVCFHLYHHSCGRFSIEQYLLKKQISS